MPRLSGIDEAKTFLFFSLSLKLLSQRQSSHHILFLNANHAKVSCTSQIRSNKGVTPHWENINPDLSIPAIPDP